MLILMLSAPLDALAVALAEVLEAEPAAVVVAAAVSRDVGREIDGDADRMELLLYGEPVEKTSVGADVVGYEDAVLLLAADRETTAELDAVLDAELETTTLLLAPL